MPDEAPEILLVEDSPDDVAFFARTLDKSGLGSAFRSLPDGAAALTFFFDAEGSPQRKQISRLRVVFLDLKLPRVSGLEVLRRLKTHPATRKIPVVVLSSSLEERDLVESYQLGVNSYIVKPMDFDVFAESVRVLCQYWLQFNQTP
jgi:two-component system, response regulator